MNNRLKNYGLWVSVSSLVLYSLQQSGLGIDIGKWTEIINRLLEIAIFMGLINNPDSEHKGFFDDKKDQ